MPMNRDELVRAITERARINSQAAEVALTNVLGELAAAQVFRQPGEEPGFINDNGCNTCPPQ